MKFVKTFNGFDIYEDVDCWVLMKNGKVLTELSFEYFPDLINVEKLIEDDNV